MDTKTEAAARERVQPDYYKSGGVDAFDVIDVVLHYELGFVLGNALKYLVRAGRKGDARADLAKAREYILRWKEQCSYDEFLWGYDWHTPQAVANAFGLTGRRREAVLDILEAAVFEEHGAIDSALAAVDAEIAAIDAAAAAGGAA